MPSLDVQATPVDTLPPASPPSTHPDLLACLRAGDTTAFSAIVDEWSPVMLRVAQGLLHDRHAAEDVVQETWLGVLTGLARFEGRSSVRSWVFAILLNQARSRRTRDARVLPSSALTDTEPSGATVDPTRFQGPDGAFPGHWTSAGAPRPWHLPEDNMLDREISQVIAQALDRLPERQRLVVEMRDVQGMSAEETCAVLQLSPANQRVLLHRGRAAVRAALEVYHDT
jgi:RNA polymerase sigma-70 factor (ECF subfamily)